LKKLLSALIVLFYTLSVAASVSVTVNGSSYTIPQTGEKGWGTNVTTWIQAISANTLQPSGGTFTLTADAYFGATYGLKSQYFKSASSNISSAGVLRLAVGDSIGWRNNANGGNLLLGVNASDKLTFDSAVLPLETSATFDDAGFTIEDDSDDTKDLQFSLGGATGSTKTTIAVSQSANRTITLPDATDTLVGKSTVDTLTNKTIDADGTGNSITNIENADIKSGAAIARNKLASGTINHVLINDGSGVMSSEATLAKSRGGAGADMSSVTFPSSGVLVTEGATQTLTAKTLTTPTTDVLNFDDQGSTPASPSSGFYKLYFKSDGVLYKLNSSGTEAAVGGGGGGSLTWTEDASSPIYFIENNSGTYLYEASQSQNLYATIRIPSSYTAGSPVNLRFTFYSPDTSGNALLSCQSTLIRTGTDAFSSTTNQRTSTNAAVTLSSANVPQSVVCDVSSSTGTVNSVALSAGDILKVRVYRGSDTATSDVRFLPFTAEVTFQ
jgi:hypothetical protein